MTPNDISKLIESGKFEQAERYARKQLAMTERRSGSDSTDVADAIDQLNGALRNQGKAGTAEARALCERAVRIRELTHAAGEAAWATSTFELACSYLATADFARARGLLSKTLETQERIVGPTHPDVASTLLMLGAVESEAGNHATAKPLLERALAIREGVYAEAPPTAECLNALATVLIRMGDYAPAEPLFTRAMGIWQKAWGSKHPRVATSLNNLATVWLAMGDYPTALAYGERALDIRRSALGSSHQWIATTQLNIGMTLAAMGRYSEARKRYREAIRIREHHFGASSSEVGTVLKRLGDTYLYSGDAKAAQPALLRAVSDLESLGSSHPDLGEGLASLAAASAATGDTASARPLQDRAVKILTASLGANHPEVGFTLTQYARALLVTHQTTLALKLSLQGEEISREHLRLEAQTLPERMALAYAATRPAGGRLAVSILAGSTPLDSNAVEKVWDSLIRSRTLILDEMALRSRMAGGSHDPEASRLVLDLTYSRRNLANLIVAGPQGQGNGYRAEVERARRKAEAAERNLAQRSSLFSQANNQHHIGYDEVAAAIPAGSTLVAYAYAGESGKTIYVAFVRVAGETRTRVVPLGRAQELERAVEAWVNDLTHGPAEKSKPRPARETGTRVRQLVWDPVANLLGRTTRVFIVPDGAINLITFAALPIGRSEYLVEKGLMFHYLSSERDLVTYPRNRASGDGLLAMGNPDFDRSESPKSGMAAKSVSTAERRGVLSDCSELGSTPFHALPNTGLEVRDVARVWADPQHTMVLTGRSADEAAFKTYAPGRRILHIATHGFFLEGECIAGQRNGSRGIGGMSPSLAASRPGGAAEANPLHLSGLALAGANRRPSDPNRDDGILTADEIAVMNLAGTEWAVLSACDTGRGRVQVGEGVLGLRRAFQIAGTASVIMSLWPVDDESTRKWMTDLYEERVKGASTAEAVHQATLQVLRERRAHARSVNPFYWAAFVATGDWR